MYRIDFAKLQLFSKSYIPYFFVMAGHFFDYSVKLWPMVVRGISGANCSFRVK